jgi:hypothetical protein
VYCKYTETEALGINRNLRNTDLESYRGFCRIFDLHFYNWTSYEYAKFYCGVHKEYDSTNLLSYMSNYGTLLNYVKLSVSLTK